MKFNFRRKVKSDKPGYPDNPDFPIPSNPVDKKFERNKTIVTWLWGIFLSIGCIIGILLLLIYNGVIGYMPPIEELEDPHDKLASTLYSSDGTEIGRFFSGSGNRVNSDYQSISPNVIEALIATEDERFMNHSGIDFKALGRTGVKTLLMGDKSSGGGSTITQQLAKQLYSQPSASLFKRAFQKPIEWMIAIKLERFYTKEEIINMYLNRFDFLNNAVGIKSASNVYFDKEPADLNIQEAAMLVGMLKNPSLYNPLRYPERTLERRNVVLEQMHKAGKISKGELESLKMKPLGLNYHQVDHKQGAAPYFRENIRLMMTAKKPVKPVRSKYKSDYAYKLAYGQYTTDSTNWADNPMYGWILKNPKPDGSYYDIYTDGLKIYTTVDLKMQQLAEDAVYKHLGGHLQPAFFREKNGQPTGPYSTNTREISRENVQKLIKNAMKQTERWRVMKGAGIKEEEIIASFNQPYTMDVFAYVQEDGKYKPGSKTVTMTPYDSLIYMKTILRTGMMSMDPQTGYVKAYVGGPDFNYFQYDMVSRGHRQIGSTVKPFLYTLAMEQDFTPCSMMPNSTPNFGGWHPRGGGGGGMITLKQALTRSNNAISARLIFELGAQALVNKMRMFGISGYIEPSLPLSLGTADVPVKEMVAAYSTFANKGLRTEPIFVSRIEDNQGNVIYSAAPHRTEVTSEDAYYKILTMLMSVVDNGTGASLRGGYGVRAQMGGKTGTTNSNSDAWFIGFTPDLVTGVWVGGEERYIHFNSMAYGQGAKAALPIYGYYMKSVYDDPKLPYSQTTRFEFPSDFDSCEGELRVTPIGGGGQTMGVDDVSEGIFD